ncbi:MAG TPA: LLM class flavin-dependent oxidoreductase [Acidimicrobiales bacterium]|nr:LLM class flavin-dependent oxidoreductase [Acidimicrobiales bacterium]
MKVRFAVSVGAGAPDSEAFASLVEEAEDLGFDTLWLSDLPSQPSVEPALGIAFAAASTSRVRLGANFIPFGTVPFVLAHRLAQLDRLSGGRLLVTLVPGLDLPEERDALGTAGLHRGRMMSSLVPRLREWWSGGGDPPLAVRPLQQPLEVWLGGSGPDAVARAGQLSDGWLGSLMPPERAGAIRRTIQEAAAAVGRSIDPEHFGLSIVYARSDDELAATLSQPGGARRLRRLDPALIPVGRAALRGFVGRLVDEGLSKFVMRSAVAGAGGAGASGNAAGVRRRLETDGGVVPAGAAARGQGELEWLADAVLDLQT